METETTSIDAPPKRRRRALPILLASAAIVGTGWVAYDYFNPPARTGKIVVPAPVTAAPAASPVPSLLRTLVEAIPQSSTPAPVTPLTPPRDTPFAVAVDPEVEVPLTAPPPPLDETHPVESPAERRMDALERQWNDFARQQEEARRAQNRMLGQVLLLSRLRESIAQGTPYETELEALDSLCDGGECADWVDMLANHAETGVITLSALQADFEVVATEAAKTDETVDRPWWKKGLDSVVTIRKVGAGHGGTDAASLIARAGAQLQAGDTSTAIATLQDLPADQQEHFAGWLEQAQAYVQVHAILDEIESALQDELLGQRRSV